MDQREYFFKPYLIHFKLETLSETYSYNIAEKQKLLNTPEFKEGLTNIKSRKTTIFNFFLFCKMKKYIRYK